MANIANFRSPSAFSQIDQALRSIHSLLHIIIEQTESKSQLGEIEDVLDLIEELFVDMWGLSIEDQLDREHETRLKGHDMMVPQGAQAGQIKLIGGRPGGGNGLGRR